MESPPLATTPPLSASPLPTVIKQFPSRKRAERGVIRVLWKPDKTEVFHSPEQIISGFPWRACLDYECSESPRDKGVEYLSLYIQCNQRSSSSLWHCVAGLSAKIVSPSADLPDLCEEYKSRKFSQQDDRWGWSKFVDWAELKKYAVEGKVTIEMVIDVKKAVGKMDQPLYNFFTEQPGFTDIKIFVDGKAFYVNKGYLMACSGYFKSMFTGEYKEKTTNLVNIKEVKACHFEEMLQAIYPCRKSVTKYNVKYLMKLADRFDIPVLARRCEKFLIQSNDMPPVAKLKLADEYGFDTVLSKCLMEFKTASEMKKALSTPEYEELSKETITSILERIIDLI